MTRVAFVADVHVANHRRFGGSVVAGINRRARLILDALAAACDVAHVQECSTFVVLGDLFDHARPEPQLIRAVQDTFAERFLRGRSDRRVVVMVGNHDLVSTAPGDHALGPLRSPDGYVEVVDGTEAVKVVLADALLVLVPYVPGRATDNLTHQIARVDTRMASGLPVVLGIHAGIRSSGLLSAWQAAADDAIDLDVIMKLARSIGAGRVMAGNWHYGEVWESAGPPLVCQVGALAPTGWDNPDLGPYGLVAVVDTREGWTRRHAVGAGPRFLKKLRSQVKIDPVTGGPYGITKPWSLLEQVEEALGRGFRPFVRVDAEDDLEFESARAWLQVAKAEGKVEDGEVLPPPSEEALVNRSTFQEFFETGRVAAALDAYVTTQPDLVADHERRADVVRVCSDCVEQAVREGRG